MISTMLRSNVETIKSARQHDALVRRGYPITCVGNKKSA
jgi:hypothetical protein